MIFETRQYVNVIVLFVVVDFLHTDSNIPKSLYRRLFMSILILR